LAACHFGNCDHEHAMIMIAIAKMAGCQNGMSSWQLPFCQCHFDLPF
jgi:hypothetical protein